MKPWIFQDFEATGACCMHSCRFAADNCWQTLAKQAWEVLWISHQQNLANEYWRGIAVAPFWSKLVPRIWFACLGTKINSAHFGLLYSFIKRFLLNSQLGTHFAQAKRIVSWECLLVKLGLSLRRVSFTTTLTLVAENGKVHDLSFT